jgi:hypothetical protein
MCQFCLETSSTSHERDISRIDNLRTGWFLEALVLPDHHVGLLGRNTMTRQELLERHMVGWKLPHVFKAKQKARRWGELS